MRTPLTVAAVAATGLLLVGGGTALALGAGGAPDELTVVPTGAAIARTADLLPPELPRTAGPAAPAPAPPAVDRAAAERAALAAAGGGRVTEVEFDRADSDDDRHDDDRDDDRSDDRDHWEVEVVNGTTEHDLDIDATTGQVLDHDVDRHDGDDDRHDRDDD
ncbi:PepSY domain-containing protein [Pseudonocardia alni]|uniref:PepSY domain-containing protein n=1 Tax=Pseudonocardia alni TaxID=33907 RepID=A0A852W4G6_PSEA5|nr:PepSY domain-containing protein [Pseudonocardia antarctica]NYG03360.1 hypothetical protein [Pseudonocardia antarctica]